MTTGVCGRVHGCGVDHSDDTGGRGMGREGCASLGWKGAEQRKWWDLWSASGESRSEEGKGEGWRAMLRFN